MDTNLSPDNLAKKLWPKIESKVRKMKVHKKKKGCDTVKENYTPKQSTRMIDMIWKK